MKVQMRNFMLVVALLAGGMLSKASYSSPQIGCPQAQAIVSKWDLWRKGCCLRGANIWQKRIDKKQDGDSLGTLPVGPPYSQKDFNDLAALGANYVHISFPGIFSEQPEHVLKPEIQASLDALLEKIRLADMFAVISFRTGPGRNESVFDDTDPEKPNHQIWKSEKAQDGWIAMWEHTAQIYKEHPVVVGYDLMVEPNSNDTLLKISDVDKFYPRYRNSLYDWNRLAKRITHAIRKVDPNTPILFGGMNWSDIYWLEAIVPTGDPRSVYTIHQYDPDKYTQQMKKRLKFIYPGYFDADYDKKKDKVDFDWWRGFLSPIPTFRRRYKAPVAVTEFGVPRFQKGAAKFLDDQMTWFERLGVNYAVWLWETSYEGVDWDEYNYRRGINRKNHTDVVPNELLGVLSKHWSQAGVRPSSIQGRW